MWNAGDDAGINDAPSLHKTLVWTLKQLLQQLRHSF
jgi:hypothetical protein